MGIFSKVIQLIVGDPQAKIIAPYWPIVEAINGLESQMVELSDDQLKEKTTEFKTRLAAGETLDALLPEAYAVVREASKRILNMRHFDVQLIGGMVLHQGKIAEMRTGEGKTLVSTLPAYLNALEGKGVYMVTVNDYLAKRDSEWMGSIFRFLGLSVGLIHSGLPTPERLEAYNSDITYGTNNEFGFDYLRDNLAYDLSQCSQTRRHYAIIDEVDSILIDEARTPLIISGPVKDSTERYSQVISVIKKLTPEQHFTTDEKQRNVIITEDGIDELEKLLGVPDIYSVENMEYAHMAIQGLKALHIFKKDVDYVVKEDQVMIVDEFTGRILDGRRYADGLHQAIEAVEGLKIREESQTLASITFQNYFRMFPKLSGMTGTALTEEAEFGKIYELEVVVVPTHRSMIRIDAPDLVYKSKAEKYKAVVNQVKEAYEKEQPILVGTISIETSELLSKKLHELNIPHRVLNAKYHEQEAEIISLAGQRGKVTIATNMAGRGTDITLGEGVAELGGLIVIGTERHESRRIDNQLRGRAGRQGDPGLSRFYVSLEDDLMRMFGSERIAKVMETLGLPEDTPIEHSMISKSIERAQSKVEKYYFGIRKQILEYDDVMNKQREAIYGFRRELLSPDNLDARVATLLKELVKSILSTIIPKQEAGTDEELDLASEELQKIFPAENMRELLSHFKTRAAIESGLSEALINHYNNKVAQYPKGVFEALVTRQILLNTLDRKWVDHIHQMEVLREGIGLRAWGQRDPLIEYKREAFDLYTELKTSISQEAFEMIFRAHLSAEEPA